MYFFFSCWRDHSPLLYPLHKSCNMPALSPVHICLMHLLVIYYCPGYRMFRSHFCCCAFVVFLLHVSERVLKLIFLQVGPDVSIYAAVMDMKKKGLCPVIAFHLDTFMALSLFKELLKVQTFGTVSAFFLFFCPCFCLHPCS